MTRIIPLTQGKQTFVDDEDFDYLSQWKWYYHKGYAARHEKGSNKKIFMHRVIANTPPGMETDHIDCDKLMNCKSNLRICSTFQNQWHRRLDKDNISGYKGITLRRYGRWQARIYVMEKCIHLGYFGSSEEAAQAYDQAAVIYFGEFAKTNF